MLNTSQQHAFAMVWNVAVAVTLVAYAASLAPLSSYVVHIEPTFDPAPLRWTRINGTYSIETDGFPVNIIGYTASYTLISAAHHGLVYAHPEWAVLLRWADYAVTAPLILSGQGVLFGAANLTAVLLAPALLAALMVVSALLEPLPGEPIQPSYRWLAIAVLYHLTWIPVIYSTAVITTADGARAPSFIWVFLAQLYCLFATFPAVYFFNPPSRAWWYLLCGLASKTSAHWFVGVTSIDNSNVLSGGDRNVWLGTLGGLGFPLLLSAIAYRYFSPEKKGGLLMG
jgi:hypothetical protein